MSKKINKKSAGSAKDEKYPLPIYKEGDDIYSREKEEPLEEEDGDGNKISAKVNKGAGSDLDVPGAELDDTNEAIGEEDEENNYYSLGGDDHNDLEEDKD